MALLRHLVAMQLDGIQSAGSDNLQHPLRLLVDEQADTGHKRWQLGNDRLRRDRVQAARAWRIKDESQGVGTSRYGMPGILKMSDAADFDLDHALAFHEPGSSVLQQFAQPGRHVLLAHQAFTDQEGLHR